MAYENPAYSSSHVLPDGGAGDRNNSSRLTNNDFDPERNPSRSFGAADDNGSSFGEESGRRRALAVELNAAAAVR